MDWTLWLFFGAKLVLYTLLFLTLGRLIGSVRPLVALAAGAFRLILGVAIVLMVMGSAIVIPMSLPDGRIAMTVLIWVYRAIAWWGALRVRFQKPSLEGRQLLAGVACGLAINLVFDLAVCFVNDPEGRGFMPSLGHWDLHLC